MTLDAIVIGAGPNGLAAAITLARAGRSVRVYEQAATIGGSTRSDALTLPGYVHDVCATVHSLVLASPFLKTMPLADFGLELVHPVAPLAHPLDDGSALVVHRSVEATADGMGRHDAQQYRKLLSPFVERADDLMQALLGPLGFRHPLLMARFGMRAIQSAEALSRRMFDSEPVRGMFAGVAAHSMVPLDHLSTAGYALGLLVGAHAFGWPVVRGGSQRLSEAMAAYLRTLGGEILVSSPVRSLDELPPSRAVLCDVTPRQLIQLASRRMTPSYKTRLERYRYGPGVFKMDWALHEAVPWRAPACNDAGTIHLGGTREAIALSERESWNGRAPERPYVLAVQASRFDASRAPDGRHTFWAYCHVPNGSTFDMRDRIESQIERAAPGFRECIASTHVMTPADMERRNPNLVGGDIAGGAADLAQFFARPVVSLDPYATPMNDVYLCSSSTPPGIGVHGMCGHYAARSALARTFR